MKKLSVTATVEIPLKRVSDLLCCALEGGSDYWCQIKKYVAPKELVFRLDTKHVYHRLDYPLNEGGALHIIVSGADLKAEKPDTYTLNLPAISRGLQIMVEKFPQHFADFMSTEEDAETGDVFLQCCLFGDVVFG